MKVHFQFGICIFAAAEGDFIIGPGVEVIEDHLCFGEYLFEWVRYMKYTQHFCAIYHCNYNTDLVRALLGT